VKNVAWDQQHIHCKQEQHHTWSTCKTSEMNKVLSMKSALKNTNSPTGQGNWLLLIPLHVNRCTRIQIYFLACFLHKYISVVLTFSSWGPVQTWAPMIPSMILTNITCIFQFSISFCHWFFQFSYKMITYITSSSFSWVLHHWKDKTLSLGTTLTDL
jgi:hypothetical protein